MGRRWDVFQFQHRRSALHGLGGDEIKVISGQQTMDFILNYQKKKKKKIILSKNMFKKFTEIDTYTLIYYYYI